MKWFKHLTDASDDIKIRRLEDKFGIQGYAIFFKIVEKVGKEGKNFKLDTKKYPLDFFAKYLMIEKNILNDCLTFMNELGLVVLENDIIYLPRMKKYADEYTQKRSGRNRDIVGTQSRQGRDNVGLEENRIDKIRKEENIASGKKPFFRGMEMRFSKGRLWCIPPDGGDWLEFVDKKEFRKEIVWK